MAAHFEAVVEKLAGLQRLKLADYLPDLDCLELPPSLCKMTELRELDLSNCMRLRALPPAIVRLKGLRQIDLSHCKALIELPPRFVELVNLASINLTGCYLLLALPAQFQNLAELEQLNLSGCLSVQSLPAEIGELMSLKLLNLGGCKSLSQLPATMRNLSSLETIVLSQCKLVCPGAEQAYLERVNLQSQALLLEIPPLIWQLRGLRDLNLSQCYWIKTLPSEMGAQTSLQRLNLSECSWLTDFPSTVASMSGLCWLNLSGCKALRELPCELASLPLLEDLNLAGCSALHTPPSDVVQRGTTDVIQYLKDLREGFIPCHILKLVLVGNERAGKSSLRDSLHAESPSRRKEDDRTVGIDVYRWRPSRQSPVIVNVFDAAGQAVYQSTHRLFMSRNCLFLNVVRMDQEMSQAVISTLKWMELLQSASPGCVVAITLSCTDLATGDDPAQRDTRVLQYMESLLQNVKRANENVIAVIATELQRLEGEVEKVIGEVYETWEGIRAERDSHMRDRDEALFCLYSTSEPWNGAGQEALARLESFNFELAKLEAEARVNTNLQSRLTELRRTAMYRQRAIFCGGASAETGIGLRDIRDALVGVMTSNHLFPGLGVKVPLSYTLLERCMRQESVADDDDEASECSSNSGIAPARSDQADWEVVCENYHRTMAEQHGEHLTKLQMVCSDPVIKLSSLRSAARDFGIDLDHVQRAIEFLNDSGSLIYLGHHVKCDSGVSRGQLLCEHVFSRPSWIIDAVKCFVHEPDAKNLNDTAREMLHRADARHHDDFLHYRDTGHLSDSLLRGLWKCYREVMEHKTGSGPDFARYAGVLVELLSSLGLIRKVDAGEEDVWGESAMYVVTSMLPRKEFPKELIDPVWMPPQSRSAAAMMRRQYSGPGIVPGMFLNGLQVEWSSGTNDVQHFSQAPLARILHVPSESIQSTALLLPPPPTPGFLQVECMTQCGQAQSAESGVSDLGLPCGSHLVSQYGSSDELVEEHVVISLWEDVLQTSDGLVGVTSTLRVMAWTRLRQGCRSATASWDLFRHVLHCIESRRGLCALLSGQPMVPAFPPQSSKPLMLALSRCRMAQTAKKQSVMVDGHSFSLEQLMPIEKRIVAKREREHGGVPVEAVRKRAGAVGKPQILAFFAQKLHYDNPDARTNVFKDSQVLTTDPGLREHFDIAIHAQPTFEEFHDELMRSNVVSIIHIAGHGDRAKGFSFMRDEARTTDIAIKPNTVVSLIATSVKSGDSTRSCVVFNSCESEEMGRELRTRGIGSVVCWRWKVFDEAGNVFARAFYGKISFLMKECGAEVPDAPMFRTAFEQGKIAVDAWEGNNTQGNCATLAKVGMTNQSCRNFNGLLFFSDAGDDITSSSLASSPLH